MTIAARVVAVIMTSAMLMTTAVGASADAPPTAEQIVAHYVSAIGGADKLASVKTLIIRGTYSEGNFRIDATLARMRPYYKLVGDPEHRSSSFEEGYDGSAWEFYGHPGIVVHTVGAASEATRHSTSILGSLADYREEDSSVSLLGSERIDDRKVWHVRLHMRDGFEQDEFIDGKSWMLVAERKVAPIHAVGAAVTTQTRFGDFRAVEGVVFPFTSREADIASGKTLNQFTVKTVVINQALDPASFSPPDFPRTASQTLIETLFLQRDDPGTVLWTLFDFRRAHPHTSSDELCRIAGYQMVKAGQFASAIALLKQNTESYPKSAAAASSLGRAYANAGDGTRARAELVRALALDPNDKRARDALDGLSRQTEGADGQ